MLNKLFHLRKNHVRNMLKVRQHNLPKQHEATDVVKKLKLEGEKKKLKN